MLEDIKRDIELAKQYKISLEKIFIQIWDLEFKVSKEELRQLNQSAFDLAEKRKSEDLYSYALAQVTFGIFYFYTNDYKQALEHHLGALDNFRLVNNEAGIGLSYMNMGATYRSLGDLDLAIKYSKEGIELLSKNNIYLKFLCYGHYGLAEIYLSLKSYSLSIENYEKALEIAYQINDTTGIIRSLNGLGNASLKIKDFQRSMDYLQKSLAKIDKDDLVLKGRILNDLGNYHFETNSLLEAKKYYEESMFLRQKLNLDDAQLSSQIGLARTFMGQNKLEEAKKFLTEGLEKAVQLKVKGKLFQFHELLSKVHETLGNFQVSLGHFKSFHQIQNEVIDENLRSRIEKIKTMHELVLKRKESESNYYQETSIRLEKQKELIEKKVLERTEELQQSNEELQTMNENLRQTQEELQTQRDFITEQNRELAQVNTRIKLSINVAKTIQEAVLTFEKRLNAIFSEYFVINRPKDVVSGDFYWINQLEGKTILVVADCTGHGVPGAFMTLIGANLLEQIIKGEKVSRPDLILQKLHLGVTVALKQEQTKNMYGMDAVVVVLEEEEEQIKLSFAGAKNNLLIWTSNELRELKGTRKSIGGIQNDNKNFENQEVLLQKGDLIYVGSDGLADQNDVKRKKIGRKKIKSTIQEIYQLPLTQQKEKFEKILVNHMKNTQQRDDILWIGVEI